MSKVYKERAVRLAGALESLKIQGLGLLQRGNVTLEELNAFRDLGETLLSGTEHTLLDAKDVSDVDETVDLELTLESLTQIIDNVSGLGYSAEALSLEHETPTMRELIKFRSTLEALKDISLTMTVDEIEAAYDEQEDIVTNATGRVPESLGILLDQVVSPLRYVGKKAGGFVGSMARGITGAAVGMASHEVSGPQRDLPHEIDSYIAIVDRAIEIERKNSPY